MFVCVWVHVGPKRGLSPLRPRVMEGPTGPLRLCTKIVLDLRASQETYIHLATGQHAMNACVSVCKCVCGQI